MKRRHMLGPFLFVILGWVPSSFVLASPSLTATAGIDTGGSSTVEGTADILTPLIRLGSTVTYGKPANPQIHWGDQTPASTRVKLDCTGLHKKTCVWWGQHKYTHKGAYTITGTDSSSNGTVLTRNIIIRPVKGFIIVSIGDSVASGEGNPVVPQRLLPRSDSHPAYWDDDNCDRSSNAAPAMAARDLQLNNPNTTITFIHLACSGYSIAQTDRDEISTLNSLLPQGSKIDALMITAGADDVDGGFGTILNTCLGPYKGNSVYSGDHLLPLDPTLDCSTITTSSKIHKSIKVPRRSISLLGHSISIPRVRLTFSIRGTPLGPSETLEKWLDDLQADSPKDFPHGDTDGDIIDATGNAQVEEAFSLDGDSKIYQTDSYIYAHEPNYGDLSTYIKGLASDVYITDYFDESHDKNGNIPTPAEALACSGDLMLPDEWKYLFKRFETPLNEKIQDAAATYRWHYVGGSEFPIVNDFRYHGYCVPGSERWVVRFGESLLDEGKATGSGHPNITGQKHIKGYLVQAINKWSPPTTSATAVEQLFRYKFGSDAHNPVTVTLSATNKLPTAGTGPTYYAVDNTKCTGADIGPCSVYHQPFSISTPGDHQIQYFSSNKQGTYESVDTATVRIDIPVAKDNAIDTHVAQPVSGRLQAKVPDSGDTITFNSATGPAHGSVTINPQQGTFTYTPASGYHGDDSFTFIVNNGYVTSNTAKESITVGDFAPVANDGSVSGKFRQTVNGQLSASDPVNGDTLTFNMVTQPAHGSVVLDAQKGTFAYTPAPNYVGDDSFTFMANNGYFTSNTAKELITVGDDAPVAKDGSITGKFDQTVNGQLLISDSADSGDALTFNIVAQPGHGEVRLTDLHKGTFIYTPAAGYTGSDAFIFDATDGRVTGRTATEEVDVALSAVKPSVQPSSRSGGGSSFSGGGALNPIMLLVLFGISASRRREWN